jgi:hypothetical protein
MGSVMTQTVETREVIEQQAQAEPHAISAYRDHQHFEETIHEAASRITRWNGLLLQWYVLTVGGVILIVLTLLKLFAMEIIVEPGAFLSGPLLLVGWTLALSWTWLYNFQVRSFSQRIIDKRLCLRCGKSLLDVSVNEHSCGVCPTCCVVFKIGEYIPPTDCIEALRRTRMRIGPLRRSRSGPPKSLRLPRAMPTLPHPHIEPRHTDLYQSQRQFNRVMNHAARRLILHQKGAVSFRIGLYVGMLPVIMFFLLYLLLSAEQLFVQAFLVFATIGQTMILMIFFVMGAVTRSRILRYRLCLSCGHPLKGVCVDDRGVGACPECVRPFHAQEYFAPGLHDRNLLWQENRQALFHPSHSESITSSTPSNTPYFADHVMLEDPPGSGHRKLLCSCKSCGYILEGTPSDEYGHGFCSECGARFTRQP